MEDNYYIDLIRSIKDKSIIIYTPITYDYYEMLVVDNKNKNKRM